ncbi:MAG: DNA methyltransferase, partial [Smithellaceae bacterium]
MKLTDNEKREILKLIEADKPLPDKYRFLLFDDKREVELVWNGKTNEVTNIVLPFQVIEQIDEPRAEKPADTGIQGDLFDFRGRQKTGWTNKLIWGDNKLILSSLKNGPIRDEIEKQGGIKLIYIDPPFDVGADFSMDIEIGDETFTKKPNVLEELAYRDTWGKGADSFIAMIYERLILMRDLLAEDGSIYVHCDYRLIGLLRMAMDEIFGNKCFRNEIIWKRTTAHSDSKQGSKHFGHVFDTLLFYVKTAESFIWNASFTAYEKEYIDTYYKYVDNNGRRYWKDNLTAAKAGGNTRYGWQVKKPFTSEEWETDLDNEFLKPLPNWEYKTVLPFEGRYWAYSLDNMRRMALEGRIVYSKTGYPMYKRFLDEMPGRPVQDLWDDVRSLGGLGSKGEERLGYPTQKPEALLERIIKA